jgi:UDP-N-acetyl-D-mannosaminuronic acid dehydrogenase
VKSRQSERSLYDADVDEARQRAAFVGGGVPVAVYGLGKMGLPLAGVYAEVTGNVVGVDVDESVARTVDAGGCHVEGEPGLAELVESQVAEGSLSATHEPTAAAEGASVHVVIVPTLLTDDNEPDLATLGAAVESIGAGLSDGDIVIVESTVPPGTCRDVVLPVLLEESGLPEGSFGLAFCPERTSSGRALADIRGSYPKVVGGVDEESTRVAELIYGQITDNDVLPTSDATTAECVKVFEGIYRDVNIALANELGRVTDDLSVDVTEAIDVANTQPYCDIHTPGPGVGGHCIPVYPYFLTNQVSWDLPLVRTARAVNDQMPEFVVRKVASLLDERDGPPLEESSVLLLGATYRAGVAETRKSPTRPVARHLTELGADVTLTDPMIESGDLASWPGTFESLDAVRAASTRDFDAVVLLTAHEEFETLDWARFDDAALVDTRRALGSRAPAHYAIGRGMR